ncbi:hypothetical protein Nepgr_013661 [Nepenthes gracilis]|uniref:Mechanosensitive ion channel protein n=1 Tax=Nepenthes gracilis TaxID=150966 RepID=A0AAD3XPM1_NEPGR|nr:hypothetical protein Nepgr_013661 [Nepenthes gracilis]
MGSKTGDRLGGEISLHNRGLEEVAIPMPANTQSNKIDLGSLHDKEAQSISRPTNNCPSPEITKFGPSPDKPPKIPTDSPTHRSLLISNSKSRFGEPSVPLNSAIHAERTSQSQESCRSLPAIGSREASFAQRTPKVKVDTKEGPDEKEIYRRITDQLSARNQKRKTVKLLAESAVFLCILGCLVSSLTVDGFKGHVLFGLQLWKWFLLLLVIFSGMLVTHWITHAIVFLIEWKFLMKKNIVYFTHGLKSSVEVFIWLSVVLGTWVLLFKPDVDQTSKTRKILDFVTWTIVSLLIGAFLWLIKTILLKILASSFHLNRFFDRIQESMFHHIVLQALSGRPLVESAQVFSGTGSHGGQEHTSTHKEKVVDMAKLLRLKQERVPAWTMQLLVDVVANSGLSTISGMLSEEIVEGGVELDDDEITSEEHAIVTTVKIFENVKGDADYIEKGDLSRFLIKEEVDLIFPLFEVNEKGQISLQAFSKWVLKVYKCRQALKHTLNDNKTAVKQLNKLVSAILIVMMFIIWLLLTEIATTKLIIFFSSQLVVAAFVFGNTCKNVFEAIIFVFVMHPFDVGDRCVIDGTMLVVEEMNIFTTVFLRWDKEKVYYPNSVLASKAIGNYYRSQDQGDSLEFSIDFMTPLSKIGDLKDRIKKYLEQNSHFWHPDHNVVVKEIENVNKIKMVLFVNHTMNFQEFVEKNRRRSELVLEVKKIFEELDIKCNLLPQEVIVSNSVPQQ